MLYEIGNLSLGRAIIFGGVRSLWRQGVLCQRNDQAIRFMQHVRSKLVLFLAMVRPGFAAFFLRSESSSDLAQPKCNNRRVAR
jgi:hypothetical protein